MLRENVIYCDFLIYGLISIVYLHNGASRGNFVQLRLA